MPYKSEQQRKFFHTNSAKEAGITDAEIKEFDKASKGKDLPERKNMAEGGTPSEGDEFTEGIKAGVNHDSDAVKSYLSSKFAQLLGPMDRPSDTTTAGNPSSIDAGVKDVTVPDFIAPALGGSVVGKLAREAIPALEGLGETGEVTLGRAAPKNGGGH